MKPVYALQLIAEAKVIEGGRDILVAHSSGVGLSFRRPDNALRDLLAHLVRGGLDRDTLCVEAMGASSQNENANLAWLYFSIGELERKGLIRYTLAQSGGVLATLEPIAPSYVFKEMKGDGKLLLSRFAYVHRVSAAMLLENPLGHARVAIHDSRCMTLLSLLTVPRSLSELSAAIPELDPTTMVGIVNFLVSSNAVFACSETGGIEEDESAPLRQWEFHDLLFHTRSRLGRNPGPWGTTYRFFDQLRPLPALKPRISEQRTILSRPSSGDADVGVVFSDVIEARRSVRTPTLQLTARQLGEFLYHTARVKEIHIAAPEQGIPYEASIRPCANGGAIHELELYLTVSRCSGIQPGLYHYDPLAHELEYLANLGPAQKQLLADAMQAAAASTAPDVLITLAARFQRVTWKYQAIAYAVILKNVGALYQHMYLVATAMNLAPCALGAGDSDLFAQAGGLDYYVETSVGEFMLSGSSENVVRM